MSFFRKKDRSKGRPLRFESLEQRELLSVAPLQYAMEGVTDQYGSDFGTEAIYPAPTDLGGAVVKVTDVTSSTITISWDAEKMTDIRTSDSFTIERLSLNSKGEEVWSKVGNSVPYSYTTGLGVYSYELTGLTALTEYTHRVTYGSTSLGTGYTDRVTATTEAQEVTAEPASSTSITLSWNFAAKGSTRYEIWVGTPGGTLANSGKYETATGTAKAMTHVFTDLDPATEYEFMIKYYDMNSVLRETQTVTCSTHHTLYIDEDTTTTDSVELYWAKAIGGTGYQLQMCTGNLTSSSEWKNISPPEVSSGGTFDYNTYYKYKVSNLKASETYHFRLRYIDGEGETRYTDPLDFVTPSSVTVENVTDTTAHVKWTFIGSSGTAYYVQVRTGTDEWADYSGANTTNQSYTLKNLEAGTTYEIRVRYTTSKGTTYTAEETVTTAVPTTLDGVTENTVTISWDIPNKKVGTNVSIQRCDGSLKPEIESNWKTIKTGIADAETNFTNEYLGSDKRYYYRVVYTDTNGEEQHTLHVLARTDGVITEAEASIDEVTLQWDFTPKNTSYDVQMAVGTPDGFGKVSTTSITDRSLIGCTITGLTPGKLYYFRIAYTSEDGTDQISTYIEVFTENSVLIATEKTETSVTLHWAPTGFTAGVQDKSYVIFYREVSERDGAGVWREYANTSQTTHTVKDLIADTVYQFKVGYSGSTEGTAEPSELSCRTEAYSLSVTGIEETKAQLIWSFSTYEHSPTYTDQGGDGKNVFNIEIYTGSSETPTEADRPDDTQWTLVGSTSGPTNRYYNLTGLLASTTYYYRVSYAVKTGDPEEASGNDWNFPQMRKYSKVVEVTTKTDIYTEYVDANSVRVRWESKGVSSYTVQMRLAGETTWSTTSNKTTSNLYLVYDGLTADTDYEFRVIYGTSGETATLKATTAKYIPSVILKEIGIENATATIQMKYSGAESNFVLWYRLKTYQDNKPWVDSGVAATIGTDNVTMTISTLHPEQQYEFKIVYTANGESIESEVFDVSLSDELSPENVTSSSVKISWQASSFADKSSTSEYTVQWREAGTADWKGTTGTDSTSYTVTGLDPNKEYEFRLQYTTIGGAKAYSTLKSVTTTQPTATATVPQVGSVKVAWTFVSTGGFVVQYKHSDGQWYTATTVSSNTSKETTFSTLEHTGNKLDSETEYTFRVAYKTSQSGNDYVYSEEVEVTTLAGLQVVDNSVTTTGVKIQWDYVTDTTFGVFYRIKGTSSWTFKITDIAKTETGYTIEGLDPGTEYEIQLNYIDGTPQTEEVTIKTTVAPPAAPKSISATDITTDSCTLKWSDNSAFEEDYILEVINSVTGIVFFKGSIGARIGSSTSSADYATHALTGLDTNTKYTVKLYAVNAEGSSAVETGTFTTLNVTQREKVTSVGATVTPRSVTLSWKIKSIEDMPDPTQASDFRIEYSYTDANKVTNWYEVTNFTVTQNTETEIWYAQVIDTIAFGGSQTVEIANNTTYKFRIVVRETTVGGTTYSDATPVEKSAKTADIKVPTVSTSSITLTGATVTVTDKDTTLDKSEKTYKLFYVEGKYTDWSKVPDDAVIKSVDVDNDTLKHTLTGLLAGTTYTYVVQWEWASDMISSKPANFTTKALPKSASIKTGYTLTSAGELASQISWTAPKHTNAIPIDGMNISYKIEVSLTGKADTFVSLLDSPTLSTSLKGLLYTSVSFSDLAKAAVSLGGNILTCKTLTIRVGATFTENGVTVGTSWSTNGKITLPKFT